MTDTSTPASHPTKRVRVTLVAYKRLDSSCIVEVPADEALPDGDELQKALRNIVDESVYTDDLDYWKDAEGHVETAHQDDNEPASFRVVRTNDVWHLERVRE